MSDRKFAWADSSTRLPLCRQKMRLLKWIIYLAPSRQASHDYFYGLSCPVLSLIISGIACVCGGGGGGGGGEKKRSQCMSMEDFGG